MVQFQVGGRIRDDIAVPQVLSDIEPLETTGARARTFHCRRGTVSRPGMTPMTGWLINGKAFDAVCARDSEAAERARRAHLTSVLDALSAFTGRAQASALGPH